MKVHIKLEGFDSAKGHLADAPQVISGEFSKAMVKSVNEVKNLAQRIYAPHRTGNLIRSIQTRVEKNGLRGIVYQDANMAPYGQAIEKGRKALTIVPVKKQALYWRGAQYPVRVVHQPARAARPFMAPALEAAMPKVREYFAKASAQIVATLAGGRNGL